MLISMLNSHPQVSAKGEIFARLDGRDPLLLLKDAFARAPYPSTSALGFKIFYYHPLDYDGDALWLKLQQLSDLHVIHLKRHSILRTLISRKRAEQTGRWQVLAGEPRNDNHSDQFTVDELKHEFARTREWESKGEKMFGDHALMAVHYEDMVADPARQFRRVTEFLGLPYVAPHHQTRKQNPGALADLLENFGELSRAFAKSEWADQFADKW